ncbi:MAG: tRNA 2-thiouridine(34) synthase MnmA [Alphaproteobacteria bacterium]|nr:tRNA 2-thiouridine(34) synthase MnmA [Alphaproteobacteria bacterium]
MKVLVGLSGGVDSAVAAYLLKQSGHDVVGATMSIWEKGHAFSGLTTADACFSPHEEQDIDAAREICKILDIPYHTLDCSEIYKKTVLENFKSEYLSGRTPNPCVWCNAKIKFRALPDAAKQAGINFDKFATGHYARITFDEKSNRFRLRRGIDSKKDQSYFLYRLSQDQLSKILFPLGDKTKAEIREIARVAGFPVSDKPDSQDFYSGDINDILQADPKPGRFIMKDGTVMGTHNGFWNYTIGQRKGLGISAPKPLYVIGFDKDNNDVIVGFEEENVCHYLTAGNLCWSEGEPPAASFAAVAKIRSSQPPTPVRVSLTAADEIKIDFELNQRGVAPGQSVVLYDGDLILGGGIIKNSGK